ncbi:MAG: FAD-dependent oxidoreductase, partial [Acidobacteria bacterium]|nr:FAD-dependent oxidoreductase [Acidobacteriota bacterium]
GSHLLLATGRKPNSDELNLGSAGIETDDRGFIKTDARLETTAAGVYALGDVNGGPAFTHISYDDYRIIRSNLLEGKNAIARGRLVPYTIFIDPQLGRVGLTEADALSRGHEIKVAKMPMTKVARALEMDETRGFMKAVIDAKSEQILGAAVLAIEGGEVMSLIEVAMMGQLPYSALRDGIFAHPTLAESLNNLFASPVPVVAEQS